MNNDQFQKMMATLSPEDQERMKEFLRDENTFLVSDVDELEAVLDHLKQQKQYYMVKEKGERGEYYFDWLTDDDANRLAHMGYSVEKRDFS